VAEDAFGLVDRVGKEDLLPLTGRAPDIDRRDLAEILGFRRVERVEGLLIRGLAFQSREQNRSG